MFCILDPVGEDVLELDLLRLQPSLRLLQRELFNLAEDGGGEMLQDVEQPGEVAEAAGRESAFRRRARYAEMLTIRMKRAISWACRLARLGRRKQAGSSVKYADQYTG